VEEVKGYELDELITRLEKIAHEKEGDLNFPKALYTLALEIQKLKLKNEAAYSASF
jgi:hypothetical protein